MTTYIFLPFQRPRKNRQKGIQVSAHDHYIPTVPWIFQEYFGIINICVAVGNVNQYIPLKNLLLGVPDWLSQCSMELLILGLRVWGPLLEITYKLLKKKKKLYSLTAMWLWSLGSCISGINYSLFLTFYGNFIILLSPNYSCSPRFFFWHFPFSLPVVLSIPVFQILPHCGWLQYLCWSPAFPLKLYSPFLPDCLTVPQTQGEESGINFCLSNKLGSPSHDLLSIFGSMIVVVTQAENFWGIFESSLSHFSCLVGEWIFGFLFSLLCLLKTICLF